MFKGLFTAVITPFKNGKIDNESLVRIIDMQIRGGVSGLVMCGSTGESQTIYTSEMLKIIEISVKEVKNKIPIIAGTGTNCTQESVDLTKFATKIGIEAAMIVAPYYNKPSQEGIYQHYKHIHDNTNIPIIIYNVPSRTGVNIECETIIKLSELERIVGLKDATMDLSRPTLIKKNVKENFCVLSGDDITSLAFNAQGGDGCISVISNLIPDIFSYMQKLSLTGNFIEPYNLHKKLFNLYNALNCDTNPVPVKYAGSLLGLCTEEVKLPLVPLSEKNKKLVREALFSTLDELKNYEKEYSCV